LHPRTEQHNLLDAILLQRINYGGLCWQLTQGGSVLKGCCQSTIVGGVSIWDRENIHVDKKKKHLMDFYHYMMVVYSANTHFSTVNL